MTSIKPNRGSQTTSTIDARIIAAKAFLDTDVAQALVLATRALSAAKRLRYARGVAQTHLLIGQCCWKLGRLSQAHDHLSLGQAAARRIRDRKVEALCVNGLGATYDRLGDFEAALMCFERFVRLSDVQTDVRAFVMATVNIGHVLERTSRLEEAVAQYESALQRLGGETRFGVPMIRMNLGVCLWLLERHDAAAARFREALEGFGQTHPMDATLCRCNLAETLAAGGDFDGADGELDIALQDAKHRQAVQLEWRALMVKGVVANRRRRHAAAVEVLLEALAFQDRCDEQELLRLTHQELAEAYERLGEFEKALAHYKCFARVQTAALESAAREAAQQALVRSNKQLAPMTAGSGAKPIRADASKAIRLPARQTSRSPGTPTRGAGLLSGRELEVLALVVQGLSNRAIGEVLSISPFTARYHLSSVFNKLGVTKRSEAAAHAMASGLVQRSNAHVRR